MKATFVLFLAFALSTMCMPTEKDNGFPINEFIQGFLDGINETGDINKLLECLKGMEELPEQIFEAVKLIATFNPKDMIVGVLMLVKAIGKMQELLEPCSQGFEQLHKLFQAVKSTDIKKIVIRIITHPIEFLKDINECINSYDAGDYYHFAKALGNMMYTIYLAERIAGMELIDAVVFVQGFLEGMGHGHVYVATEDCITEVPLIYAEVIEAIKIIKEVDWKSLENVVQALTKLVDAVRHILETARPCSAAPEELAEILVKIGSIDIEKFQQKMLMNSIQLLSDFSTAFSKLHEAKYQEAGISCGDIVYLLVFKE